MARYIALLRAVNVGGTGKLRMIELSEALENAGYLNVQTVLASGNVVLDTAKTPTAILATRLETVLHETLGLTTDIMVRTPEQWAAMMEANPMPEAAVSSPSAFAVMVVKGTLEAGQVNAFIESWEGPEKIQAGEGCLYIHYTHGMGQSTLKLPKTIGVGTVRHWNTVGKLSALT